MPCRAPQSSASPCQTVARVWRVSVCGMVLTLGLVAGRGENTESEEAAWRPLPLMQNHDPGDVVWFKEVSVRPLPDSSVK